MAGKRIVGVIAALAVASGCGTTPSASSLPPLNTATSTRTSSTTTTTSTTPTAEPVAVPVDLAGKTAATVEAQLKGLGFRAIKFLGPDGSSVAIDSTWTVASVDRAGSSLAPDEIIYVRVDKPKPAPAPAPKTTTKTATPKPPAPPATQKPATPKPAPAPYYKNCTAARAAGVTPLHRGQPGYGSHLDRDGDGIACE
jgi:hypothetical protein